MGCHCSRLPVRLIMEVSRKLEGQRSELPSLLESSQWYFIGDLVRPAIPLGTRHPCLYARLSIVPCQDFPIIAIQG